MNGEKDMLNCGAGRSKTAHRTSTLGRLSMGSMMCALLSLFAAQEPAHAQVTPVKGDSVTFSVQAPMGKPIKGWIRLTTNNAQKTIQDRSYVFDVVRPGSGVTKTTATATSVLTLSSTAEATLERPMPGHHAFVQHFDGKLKVEGSPQSTQLVLGTTLYFRAADGSTVANPVQLKLDTAEAQTEVEFTTSFLSSDGKTPGDPVRGTLRLVQTVSGPRFIVALVDDSDQSIDAVDLEVIAPPESGWPQKSVITLTPSSGTLRVELTADKASALRDVVGLRNGTTGPFALNIGDQPVVDVTGDLTVSSDDTNVPAQSLGVFDAEGRFVPALELEVTDPLDLDDQLMLGIGGVKPTEVIEAILDVEASPLGVFEGDLPEASVGGEVKVSVTLFDRNGKALETEACALTLKEKARCSTSLGGAIAVMRFSTGQVGTVRPVFRYTGVELKQPSIPRVASTLVTSPQYPHGLSLDATPSAGSTTSFSTIRTWHRAGATGDAMASMGFLQEEGQSPVTIVIPASGLMATTTASHCPDCDVVIEATTLDVK